MSGPVTGTRHRVIFTSENNFKTDTVNEYFILYTWTTGDEEPQKLNVVGGRTVGRTVLEAAINEPGNAIVCVADEEWDPSRAGLGKFEVFLLSLAAGRTERWVPVRVTQTPRLRTPYNPSVSADGTRITFKIDHVFSGQGSSVTEGVYEIWDYAHNEVLSNRLTRLTESALDPAPKVGPVYSQDGTTVVFGSAENLLAQEAPEAPTQGNPEVWRFVLREDLPETNILVLLVYITTAILIMLFSSFSFAATVGVTANLYKLYAKTTEVAAVMADAIRLQQQKKDQPAEGGGADNADGDQSQRRGEFSARASPYAVEDPLAAYQGNLRRRRERETARKLAAKNKPGRLEDSGDETENEEEDLRENTIFCPAVMTM